jgi:malonyl-CoA O-methyltransferase
MVGAGWRREPAAAQWTDSGNRGMPGTYMLDPHAVRERFNDAARSYDRHAALEQEVGRRLLERCEFTRQEPRCILDLGCGTGTATVELKKKFRRSRVIGVDSAIGMLALLRRRSGLLRPLGRVCADLSALPFAPGSADLLFSNLATQWSPDPAPLFGEFRRVLQPGGMLLFSTLGPGTLRELHGIQAAGGGPGLRGLGDLMVVGDALVAAGFSEPVMDMEVITVKYRSLEALRRELESTGMSLLIRGWEGSVEWRDQLESALGTDADQDGYSLTFEIIYGTAFGPPEGQPVRTAEGDVATFSVERLLKSRRLR